MSSVFLSHSARDAKLAAAVRGELRKRAVEVFDASQSGPETGYIRQAVKSAIRRAAGFVLVVGAPEAASASWATYELGMADMLGKPILLLLSRKHVAGELPAEMAGLAIVPLDPAHPELAASEVVDRLLAIA